jgi:hypothetical protein
MPATYKKAVDRFIGVPSQWVEVDSPKVATPEWYGGVDRFKIAFKGDLYF